MSQSKTKHKTSWYQILFRICILLLSIFLGIEGGLYIWEQWQYSNAVKKIQLPEDLGSTKQQTYILALGDSITQLGYAKILENTKGGEYTLHNAAAAGSSIDVVKKTLLKQWMVRKMSGRTGSGVRQPCLRSDCISSSPRHS